MAMTGEGACTAIVRNTNRHVQDTGVDVTTVTVFLPGTSYVANHLYHSFSFWYCYIHISFCSYFIELLCKCAGLLQTVFVQI